MDRLATLALEHFLLKMRPLNRALRCAVKRQASQAAQLVRPDIAALCVTDDQVQRLLSGVDDRLRSLNAGTTSDGLTPEEQAKEAELRAQADELGARLPFDYLSGELGLTPFEQEAVLICAAPEIDRSYERIYAYVLDDLNRRFPCVELLCGLTADSIAEQSARRQALGRWGKLRRNELLRSQGEAAIESRQELRLAPELLGFLTGTIQSIDGLFIDRAEVCVPAEANPPPTVPAHTIERFARMVVDKRINIIGIWGPRDAGHDECVVALAAAARKPLRRLLASELEQSNLRRGLAEMFDTAALLGAILWIDTDAFDQSEHERLRATLANALGNAACPVLLTGVHPWRPTNMLAAQSYAEIELAAMRYDQRQSLWSLELPEIQAPQASDLAARFRLSGAEVRAVARVARTLACVNGNGHPAGIGEQMDAACSTVTRKSSSYFASLIKPRRRPEDLILPPDLHRQVMEISKFVRAGPLVDEAWGFGRLSPGSAGVKVLMTGESGTGKTLAAEVIAGTLGLFVLKVDLSRIVSKWVGESERNLEMIFREAEESHSVLVFDECESLFGRRGEIQSGTDRYSNLEVGYLLQRLESYYGLAILTSNLKDQIDSAFTRRFQVILHFPLPGIIERRRIWQIAFPDAAPVEAVDFDLLQNLDLTGAGIVAAARTAALLAADDRSGAIHMSHVVKAIARQYQREARLLTAAQLGQYATLL